jgi:hypothetical protein
MTDFKQKHDPSRFCRRRGFVGHWVEFGSVFSVLLYNKTTKQENYYLPTQPL